MFIWSGGLLWKFVEIQVDWLSVYSDNDTILDHVFNTLGGLRGIVTGPWVLRRAYREIAAHLDTLPAASTSLRLAPSISITNEGVLRDGEEFTLVHVADLPQEIEGG